MLSQLLQQARVRCACRYLSGWFIVDVAALSPLHWVVPLLGKELTHQFVVGGIDILKLSQACKLLRVLRFPRILKRLEVRPIANPLRYVRLGLCSPMLVFRLCVLLPCFV